MGMNKPVDGGQLLPLEVELEVFNKRSVVSG